MGKTADTEDEGVEEEERTECCHREGFHRGVNVTQETQNRCVTETVPVDSDMDIFKVMLLLLVENTSCRVLQVILILYVFKFFFFFLLFKAGNLWKVHLCRPMLVKMS